MLAQEKKNRTTGIYVSIISHGVLLLLFLLFLAWTEPDPPIPDYGIEFNLGISELSDTQTEDSESLEEVEQIQDSPQQSDEVVEKSVDQPEQVSQEETAEVSQKTSADAEPTEPVETEDINSPDIAEEIADESKETIEEEKKPAVVEQNEQPEESKKETEIREEKTPQIDERAIYKGKADKSTSGNRGASLDFSGWVWDFKPQPDDKSEESGRIIFEVTVDEEGEILGVRKIQSNVSPVVEKAYRDAVMDLTFSRTADNRSVAATSKGRITFIIQSN